MTETEELRAIEGIKRSKARYLRGVDTSDGPLVRGILAEDCVLDYMGCCTDPASGRDFLPTMNVVMKGRDSWSDGGMAAAGIVSAHHSYNFDITFTSDTTADSICAFTDRLYLPEGAPYGVMVGYGWYHETYEKLDGVWKIKHLRIVRSRVESD